MWGTTMSRLLAQLIHGADALRAREGSHLCHTPRCIRPSHIIPEYASTNHNRSFCIARVQASSNAIARRRVSFFSGASDF